MCFFPVLNALMFFRKYTIPLPKTKKKQSTLVQVDSDSSRDRSLKKSGLVDYKPITETIIFMEKKYSKIVDLDFQGGVYLHPKSPKISGTYKEEVRNHQVQGV